MQEPSCRAGVGDVGAVGDAVGLGGLVVFDSCVFGLGEVGRAARNSEVADHVERCKVGAWAESFAASMGIDGRCANDYVQKLVPVRAGDGDGFGTDDGGEVGRVLCGVRFLGGDRDRPFVDVLGYVPGGVVRVEGGLFGDAGLFGRAASAAMSAYRVFDPVAVRVLVCRGGGELSTGGAPGLIGVMDAPLADGFAAELDQVFVAATIDEMLALPEPAGYERIGVAPADDIEEALGFVDRAYAAFAARRPELARRVPPADRDQLRSCVETGALVWWTVDGQRAGLLGVARQRAYGLDGYCVMEEVTDPEMRGLRSAAGAQRRLIEILPARCDVDGTPLVYFGTIDAANLASRRAASDAGRREVSAWWFLLPVVEGRALRSMR